MYHIFFLCGIFLAISNLSAITTEFFIHTDFANASTGLTVIDFEGVSQGTKTGNEFAAQGLVITHRDNRQIVVGGDAGSLTIASGVNALSSSFYNSSGATSYDNNATDNFDFTLSQGANAAGLFMGNIGPGTTSVQFLDASLNIIAEETFDSNHAGVINPGGCCDNRVFYGITTDQQVAVIRTIEASGDNDGIIYDDIQFNQTTIPEPSSLAFVFLSFIFIATLKDR